MTEILKPLSLIFQLKIVARGDEIKVYEALLNYRILRKDADKLINYSLRFENIEDNLISSIILKLILKLQKK